MVDPTVSRTTPNRQYPWIAILAGLIAILGVALLWGLRDKPSPPSNLNQTKPGTVVSTPSSYTDFIGVVKTASPTEVSLETSISDPSGQTQSKTFSINLAETTEYFEIFDERGQRRVEPRTKLDLKPGDKVQAFAESNLAEIDGFTALRLVKLNS